MSVKLRLLRKGRKKRAFYYIVAADSRAPRDGRFIERVGSYNPNTDPATIDLDVDRSVTWLRNGAQPTDTVRAILSYKGVMYKNHLLKGVDKGALTEEEANAKFEKWLDEKSGKVDAKRSRLAEASAADAKSRLEAEAKIREDRAKAIIAKNSPLAEEVEAAPETEASADDVSAEAEVEAPEVEEAPAAEEAPAVEEVAAEEPVAEAEAPAAEVAEEAPAAEETEEEKPAE
ncbi:MAG: 30S ribosomal protein S16 [Flavobacteriales bacterium]|nr:30S ribosomal protein S16 [Bacteroidota bacterium]MCB9239518.1 30S ribosomal protein S16 [Flavobacteriales bacterium]